MCHSSRQGPPFTIRLGNNPINSLSPLSEGFFLGVVHQLIMSNPFLAITMGAGLGMLLCVGGNQWSSHLAHSACKDRPTHQVIYTDTFLGDTYSCVKRSWLR